MLEKNIKAGDFMDINTIRLIRNGLNDKEVEAEKSQIKKKEKWNSEKGCLKLADYMIF